jgi:membrane-bound lytic murein transglycosylase A
MAEKAGRRQKAAGLRAFALAMMLMTAASASALEAPPNPPGAEAVETLFAALAGWEADNHLDAWRVFKTHCAALAARAPALREGAAPPDQLQNVCAAALGEDINDAVSARRFFERWFTPFEIRPESGAGFLTGYYEPEVEGARERSERFSAPLLARPDDLVTIAQGETLPGVPAGFAAARRRPDGGHEAYDDRGAILDGALGSRARPILWLQDDVEVFFMQVQGSGRVRLPDGGVARIAYAGRNGHPYSSIGRIVVQEGLLPLEAAKLDGLKPWLRGNPAEGRRVMRMNRSYVFFRLADELPAESGPIGGAGLPLTPWRSIAVDRSLWAYGLPVWIETDLPVGSGTESFRKLTIAEDTGSAILGPARADLFHGSGAEAGTRAGALRHPMRFVTLWPRAKPKD